MFSKNYLLAILIIGSLLNLCSTSELKSQEQKKFNVCISSEEKKLYELIMEYRKSKGLEKIPLSKSLTFVARVHAKDINDNPAGSPCNMHSWSDKGTWKGGCYTSDHKNASCMWDKPRELTNYPGDGFEIAHGGGSGYNLTAESALASWKTSKGHNAVIINEGIWTDQKWNAIGIGMYGGHAVVWFGREIDSEGTPDLCK